MRLKRSNHGAHKLAIFPQRLVVTCDITKYET